MQYGAGLVRRRRSDDPLVDQVERHRAWAYQGDGGEEALGVSRIRVGGGGGDTSLSGNEGGRLRIEEAGPPLIIVESLLPSKSRAESYRIIKISTRTASQV